MTNFSQCPRCNGEWIEDTKYDSEQSMDCSNCKMIWLPKENVCWLYFSTDDSKYLYWNLDQECCYYVSSALLSDYQETKLPMLPFDILYERLNLLILFS